MVRLYLTVDLQASSQTNPQVHRRKCTVNDARLSNLSPETNNSIICEGGLQCKSLPQKLRQDWDQMEPFFCFFVITAIQNSCVVR